MIQVKYSKPISINNVTEWNKAKVVLNSHKGTSDYGEFAKKSLIANLP